LPLRERSAFHADLETLTAEVTSKIHALESL
jgi:hypothetical protein